MSDISGIPFTKIKITDDSFWGRRLQTNRNATLPTCLKKCEDTGRFENFAVAAGIKKGKFQGIYFNDSDVFKIIEGASYILRTNYDSKLDNYLDKVISWIAGAQENDGYLYTARTINDPDYNYPGKESRWSHLDHGHELYNVGHLYEAAVAHYQATGKRTLLDVAIKNADLICDTFGAGKEKNKGIPGHEEIEIGLTKLAEVTGNDRYIVQVKIFLERRGHGNNSQKDKSSKDSRKNIQDHLPVTKQTEAVGHAVRAGYLYTAMTDIARHLKDSTYRKAVEKLWKNIVNSKLYITGGIGSRHAGEEFGEDYELPNDTAYCETCAAISNIFFNYRLFLLNGDGKYMDVLERVLYNGFLSGVSFSGKEFFYVNLLEWDKNSEHADKGDQRKPWFGCACCPSNIVRFLPSLPGYVYSKNENGVDVNLFIPSKTEIRLNDMSLKLKMDTDYPYCPDIKIAIEPENPTDFSLRIRIPGWARNQPITGDLYKYATTIPETFTVSVNGNQVKTNISKGYITINRKWQKGDVVYLCLPMPIRKVICHENVINNRKKVALEAGPLVYCVESIDSKIPLSEIKIGKMDLKLNWNPKLLGGVKTIKGENFLAIPYYARAHRNHEAMKVWLNI